MLQDQINALALREQETMDKIARFEEETKKAKGELTVIKRAKQSLERLEEQLNGQNVVSDERVTESEEL